MKHTNVIQLHPTAPVLTLIRGGSETSLNERKRWARRDVWRHAESRTEFYRRLLNLADVAPRAAEAGVIEANYYRTLERSQILDAYRAAKAAQIRTPAPDQAAVTWKRRSVDWCMPIKPDEIEKAIATDEKWLKDHPTRQSNRRANSEGGAIMKRTTSRRAILAGIAASPALATPALAAIGSPSSPIDDPIFAAKADQ